MTRSLILGAIGSFCLFMTATAATAAPAPDLNAGRDAYVTNCARCHGDTGKGDGPDARRMVPRPRDFTTGSYKFRTTASGTPPTDEDLFHTITVGLAGTRMPGWEGLSEETRWQLVAYLKSLSPTFTTLTSQPVDVGTDPGPKKADLAKGKQLYADLGCAACHGTLGRANGPSAKTLVDDEGQPIAPADLTQGWTLRGGAEPRDLVTRLMTGVDGTPMPSYGDAVAKEDLWQLAHYLRSIQEPVRWGWTVTAAKVDAVPASPTDPVWQTAPRTDVTLWNNLYVAGEIRPASIPWAVIHAVHTTDTIAFRIGWDDPSEDRGTPPDQLALVFKPDTAGWTIGSLQSWPRPEAPALDVLLWSAAAPGAELSAGTALWPAETAREAVTAGFELPSSAAARPAQARYEDGRWWLMVTRPVQDSEVPLALVVWDGGRGDTGRLRSVSTWLDVRLESTTHAKKERRHGTH